MVTKLMLETVQTEQTSIEIMHFVMIEAIHSKRTQTIQWEALNDTNIWRQGWL